MDKQSTSPVRRKTWATRLNSWTFSLTRHWLATLLIVIGMYVSLPIAAPVLMHLGLTGPGRLLYTIYSPFCHQFPFRSWFLFGEQPAYPRVAANVAGLQPWEAFPSDVNQALDTPINLADWTQLVYYSREYDGDPRMGYKVALCERDIAIFGTLFLGGLVFAIPPVRRRLRPLPIWLYVVIGLVPIGLDGFSQLLSEPPFSFWVLRESTPLFRTLTGALFGLANAWLAFPYLEESARQVTQELEAKFARVRQREQIGSQQA